MSVARVTSADVAALRCPYCGRTIAPDTEWVATAQRQWGCCGFAVDEDGERVAVLLLAPDAAAERALVMALWVDGGHAQRGLGKRLVQTACATFRGRDVGTIVACAGMPPTCSALPKGFLRRCGFVYVPGERVWMLDVDATVTDRPSARDFVRQLVASLRPVNPPAPAARADRASSVD